MVVTLSTTPQESNCAIDDGAAPQHTIVDVYTNVRSSGFFLRHLSTRRNGACVGVECVRFVLHVRACGACCVCVTAGIIRVELLCVCTIDRHCGFGWEYIPRGAAPEEAVQWGMPNFIEQSTEAHGGGGASLLK